MRLLSKCESCRKRKLLIYKRKYVHPKITGVLTSKSNLCGPCFKAIKSMIV